VSQAKSRPFHASESTLPASQALTNTRRPEYPVVSRVFQRFSRGQNGPAIPDVIRWPRHRSFTLLKAAGRGNVALSRAAQAPRRQVHNHSRRQPEPH
jgi:hypothetical protein